MAFISLIEFIYGHLIDLIAFSVPPDYPEFEPQSGAVQITCSGLHLGAHNSVPLFHLSSPRPALVHSYSPVENCLVAGQEYCVWGASAVLFTFGLLLASAQTGYSHAPWFGERPWPSSSPGGTVGSPTGVAFSLYQKAGGLVLLTGTAGSV